MMSRTAGTRRNNAWIATTIMVPGESRYIGSSAAKAMTFAITFGPAKYSARSGGTKEYTQLALDFIAKPAVAAMYKTVTAAKLTEADEKTLLTHGMTRATQ
jgi:hypothetical protein